MAELTTRTVYPVIADPPLLAGAVHDTTADALLAVATAPVGAPGIVLGVAAELADDAGEVPAALVAFTVNVYAVPFVRPPTVADVADVAPVVVALSPPGDAVTVYPVIADPTLLAGPVHDTTQEIADVATTWGRFEGADVYLCRGLDQIRTWNPDVGRPMADGVRKFRRAGVTYLRSKPRRMANVKLSAQGRACYTVLDDTVPWQDRLEQVTAAMVALPEDTDLAFVQYSSAYTISWIDLQSVRPVMPHVKESDVRYNRHLNCRYTPDAH